MYALNRTYRHLKAWVTYYFNLKIGIVVRLKMVTPTLEVWLHTADRDRADLEMLLRTFLFVSWWCMSLGKKLKDYLSHLAYSSYWHGRFQEMA